MKCRYRSPNGCSGNLSQRFPATQGNCESRTSNGQRHLHLRPSCNEKPLEKMIWLSLRAFFGIDFFRGKSSRLMPRCNMHVIRNSIILMTLAKIPPVKHPVRGFVVRKLCFAQKPRMWEEADGGRRSQLKIRELIPATTRIFMRDSLRIPSQIRELTR